jgi:NAD(P)H dehydrogenase (quinone)
MDRHQVLRIDHAPIQKLGSRGRRLDVTASIILAHPYEKSFNHAIFARAIRAFKDLSTKVYDHDLYTEGLDPILPKRELGKEPCADELVLRYAKELMESDFLVFVHPNWWGQPPAIMKGYIDRVIRPPYAYDFDDNDGGGGIAEGRLGGKVGIVFNTSNTEASRESGYFHDPLEYIWGKCVFGFCGIEDVRRRMFRIVSESSHKERTSWLDEVAAMIESAVKERSRGAG